MPMRCIRVLVHVLTSRGAVPTASSSHPKIATRTHPEAIFGEDSDTEQSWTPAMEVHLGHENLNANWWQSAGSSNASSGGMVWVSSFALFIDYLQVTHVVPG